MKNIMYRRLMVIWLSALLALVFNLTGCGKAVPSANVSPGACSAYASTWKNVVTNNNMVLKADCTGTDADCNGTFTYSVPSNGFAVGAVGTVQVNVLTGQPGGLIQANGARCPAIGANTLSYTIPSNNQLQTNWGTGTLTYNQQ